MLFRSISNQLSGNFNAENGELIALREGLLLAHFYQLKVDLAEVFTPSVVSILNDSRPLVGESKYILNDIKCCCIMLAVVSA